LSTVWVLDASAVLCYLLAEEGYQRAKAILRDAREHSPALLSAVNWSEVLHKLLRRVDPGALQRTKEHVALLPIQIVPLTAEGAESLARLRAKFRLSMGDAAVASLAEGRRGTIVTSDPDFRSVEGSIPVEWLRHR